MSERELKTPEALPNDHPEYRESLARRDRLAGRAAGLLARIEQAMTRPNRQAVEAGHARELLAGREPVHAVSEDLDRLRSDHRSSAEAHRQAEAAAHNVRVAISHRVQDSRREEYAALVRATYAAAHAFLAAEAEQEHYLRGLERGGTILGMFRVDRLATGVIGPVIPAHLREMHRQITAREFNPLAGTGYEAWREPAAGDDDGGPDAGS